MASRQVGKLRNSTDLFIYLKYQKIVLKKQDTVAWKTNSGQINTTYTWPKRKKDKKQTRELHIAM